MLLGVLPRIIFRSLSSSFIWCCPLPLGQVGNSACTVVVHSARAKTSVVQDSLKTARHGLFVCLPDSPSSIVNMVGGGNQPQTRGDTAGRKMQPRLFSSVVKAKPIAALFPSNEILAQGMAATTVSTEKSVMLLLQKDMMPVEVGVALALLK